MLGGLAKWLRALGHETYWIRGIEDGELIRFAVKHRVTLLTSDTGIMKRGIVASGQLPALFIPAGIPKKEQFVFVAAELKLKKRDPRCMVCAGELVAVDKEMNRSDIPPKTYIWLNDYYRCSKCNKLFWKGTHWKRIDSLLDDITHNQE
jgi:uncharacterized protein with PIN domain